METTISPDHDLLIKLNENVSSLRNEMRQLTDQFNGQLSDHEARLRLQEAATDRGEGSLKTWQRLSGAATVILLLLQALVMFYVGTHH